MEAIKPSNIRLKHAKKRLKAAFWIAIITLQVIHGQGKTYYISNSGDDLHSITQAQSPETPWKSLKKASTYEFKPGDSILFRSGDDFFGNLLITESGTAEEPIVFSKYGDGKKPVISGAMEILNWKNYQENIFVADVSKNVTQVFLNKRPLTYAREPDTGYFRMTAVEDKFNRFSCANLAENKDWFGAAIHIRSALWSLDPRKIKLYDLSTKTIELDTDTEYTMEVPEPFFINGHLSALDNPGEWFYDDENKKLFVCLNPGEQPASFKIIATTVHTGISVSGAAHVVMNGLRIDHHHVAGVHLFNSSSNITLVNNDVTYPYGYGIRISGGNDNSIQQNTIYGPVWFGIKCASKGSVIEGNHVSNVGLIARVNKDGIGCCNARGIQFSRGNITVRHNSVDSTGYNGIGFYDPDNIIEENIIRYFCLDLCDGTAIGTWSHSYDAPGAMGTVIKSNIIIGGTGPDGAMNFPEDNQGGNNWWYNGIYLDDRTHGIEVMNNSIYNTFLGIYLHNTKNHIIRGNNIYGANNHGIMLREDDHGGSGQMTGNKIINNKVFMLASNYFPVAIESWYKSVRLAEFDSNFYYHPLSVHSVYFKNDTLTKLMNLNEWNRFSGDDAHTLKNAFYWNPYTISDTLTGNLISNGAFSFNDKNWSCWSEGSCDINWTKHQTLSGGSLQINEPSDNSKGVLTSSPAFRLKANTTYLFSFDAKSEARATHQATIRKAEPPWTTIFTIPLNVEKGWKKQSFMFETTRSFSNARADFELFPGNAEWYLDNVELLEINKTDPEQRSMFIYNADSVSKETILNDQMWMDMDSNQYLQRITLSPYQSKILFFNKGTNDTIAPVLGGNLNTLHLKHNQVELIWNQARDNSDQLIYNIYQDGALICSTSTYSIIVEGLTGGTDYTFTVQAMDFAGNLSDSIELQLTTPRIFSLSVTNGQGTGWYEPGEIVVVNADDPPDGQIFYSWKGNIETLADTASPTTELAMPEHDVVIEAIYNNASTLVSKKPMIDISEPTIRIFKNKLIIEKLHKVHKAFITDVFGKVIFSGNIESSSLVLNVRRHSQQVLFITIIYKNDTIVTRKIFTH